MCQQTNKYWHIYKDKNSSKDELGVGVDWKAEKIDTFTFLMI